MAPPKYRPGQRVVVLPDSSNSSVRPGIYTITRVMPAEDEGIRYRAKNEMDTHERVLHEAQLRPADGVASLMTVDKLRETARSKSGGEQAHRKRQSYRRDHAFQTHAAGVGESPDFGTSDGHRAAPHREGERPVTLSRHR